MAWEKIPSWEKIPKWHGKKGKNSQMAWEKIPSWEKIPKWHGKKFLLGKKFPNGMGKNSRLGILVHGSVYQ